MESVKNSELSFVFSLCNPGVFSVRIFQHLEEGHECVEWWKNFRSVPPVKFFSFVNTPLTCSYSYSLNKCIRLDIMFVISIFFPPKMNPEGPKSTWEKYGTFLNSLHPNTKRLVRRLQSINYEIGRSEVFVFFNHIYIYMCVCVWCALIYPADFL